MGCLMPLVKEVLVGNYFSLGAKINRETFGNYMIGNRS
jgi:hypothetical protein